jgi:cyclic pyranopterin phosphate synthase
MADHNQDETMGKTPLTHLDSDGGVHMVNISKKEPSQRTAVAKGYIRTSPETLEAIKSGKGNKGDVLQVAKLAAISAGKHTGNLIPLCHVLSGVSFNVDVFIDEAISGVVVQAEVNAFGQTGLEMEALTTVTVGLLTVYDMAKSLDRGMVIEGIRLIIKDGGKSGRWSADI